MVGDLSSATVREAWCPFTQPQQTPLPVLTESQLVDLKGPSEGAAEQSSILTAPLEGSIMSPISQAVKQGHGQGKLTEILEWDLSVPQCAACPTLCCSRGRWGSSSWLTC